MMKPVSVSSATVTTGGLNNRHFCSHSLEPGDSKGRLLVSFR